MYVSGFLNTNVCVDGLGNWESQETEKLAVGNQGNQETRETRETRETKETRDYGFKAYGFKV